MTKRQSRRTSALAGTVAPQGSAAPEAEPELYDGRPPAHLRGSLPTWAAPIVAVAGGVLWALCFQATPHSVLSCVALTPLVWLLWRPRAVLLAFLFGFTFWVASIPWIAPTVSVYGGLQPLLGWLSLAILAGYLGAFFAAFAALGRRLVDCADLLLLVAAPALWVALEWLRAHLISGFPWNLAGYAWVDVPGALPATSWIGAYGVSFLVLWTATSLALALEKRRLRFLAALLLPAAVLAAAHRLPPPQPAAATVDVRLLQPNFGIVTSEDVETIRAQTQRLFEMSERNCRRGGLLVWPESAGFPYAFDRDGGFRARVLQMTRAQGCTLLLNTPRWDGDAVFNTAALVAPGGGVVSYDKRHLVPFGEYFPFQDLLPFGDSLARNVGNFSAGDEATLLPAGAARIGVSVCFEVVFPFEVAAFVRAGATHLMSITNDAWYGDSSAPWQHLRAARFRAAESRRPMLRAALTGVSANIGPRGEVLESIGVDAEGVIAARVAGGGELSPYSRAPWLVPALLTLVAAGGIFWRRREPAAEADAATGARD